MAATSTLEENKRIARRVPEEIVNQRRSDLVESVFAADAVEHGGGPDVEGREALRAMFETYFDAFADMNVTVEDVFAEDDRVAMRVRIRGEHVGEFMGVAPAERPLDVPGIVISRIEEGAIAERWVRIDTAAMLRQMGADRLPSP